jgi:hypothetical protein
LSALSVSEKQRAMPMTVHKRVGAEFRTIAQVRGTFKQGLVAALRGSLLKAYALD